MNGWEIVRHGVPIYGRVTCAQTDQPISGAWVTITGAPVAFTDWLAICARQYGPQWSTLADRPDRTQTAADGHYHFLNLPDGQYSLIGSMPGSGSRYGQASVNVTVSRDSKGRIIMAAAHIALPPTTLQGQITGPAAEPVWLAELRVKGSDERAFSNAQGRYLLAGLEVGTRTVVISAQGYKPALQTVRFTTSGETKSGNFVLAK